MPAPERRKSRRETPCALAFASASASSRAANSFCWGEGGGGMNSSLEQMRLGMGPTASAWASRSHLRTHMAAPSRWEEKRSSSQRRKERKDRQEKESGQGNAC